MRHPRGRRGELHYGRGVEEEHLVEPVEVGGLYEGEGEDNELEDFLFGPVTKGPTRNIWQN